MDIEQVQDQAMNGVVSAEWLYEHLDDPQVAIADCRFSLADPELGQRQYQEGHIPGAYYFDLNQDLSSPVGQHGGRHPLPNVSTLAEKLRAIGVYSRNGSSEDPDSENSGEPTLVVAYDDSRFAFAARFWWLLRYLGHEHVVILDGGFSGWQANYPVSNAIPEPKVGNFVPRVQGDRILDIEAVKSRKDQPGVVLVDSREGDRYRGEREPIDPIAGHIPGAINYPWQMVTTSEGQVRSSSEQQQHWAELAHAEEIVVYCGSGVTACVNLFSLEITGIRNAKLYPGSWSDWCSYL
jgi:thiosulfate/3-mercaptopyruvate sulfurtransferase